MKIEKTLSKMFPGTSKLVIELVVEYALRCAHAEIAAESLIAVQEYCNVTIKRPVVNMSENELDFQTHCYSDKNLSNDCAAAGMLRYAKLTGAIPAQYDVDDIWLNALTAAKDMLTVLV